MGDDFSVKNWPWAQTLCADHLKWLASHAQWRAKRWKRLFDNDPESALCEAQTKYLLEFIGVQVRPYEHRSGGGPDYICDKSGNSVFYAEATTLKISSIQRVTGRPHLPKAQGGYSSGTTCRLIRQACTKKAEQMSNLNLPSLLVIGTLHFTTSTWKITDDEIESALIGVPSLAIAFRDDLLEPIPTPCESTALCNSAFIRFDPPHDQVVPARRSISAFLFCGFGALQYPINSEDLNDYVKGGLNVDATRMFPDDAVSGIRFCRASVDHEKETISPTWQRSPGECG